MFTVWYICTPVACDSWYTLSTVRKLTPRAATVLSLDHYHKFASIFSPFLHLEFIEMVPFLSNDCIVTSRTHVWLL